MANRFPTVLKHVGGKISDHLVEWVVCRGLLDPTYCIDSTDVRTMPDDQDVSKCYDSTTEEYYCGYAVRLVSTGQILIAEELTESKQVPEETAMRVTHDALAVAQPIWMIGNSAFDTHDRHDHLLTEG